MSLIEPEAMRVKEGLKRLGERVQYLVEHARRDHPLGVVGYTPAAFGEGYDALYLRDFTYMAESAPEFVPPGHVRKILELFVSRFSPEGLCPERIGNDGTIFYVCHGTKPAADCAMFLVKLAAAYAGRAESDAEFVAKIFPQLCRTIATVPVEASTGLVWIDPASPHTAYGFTDTIAITGQHLYCSLLLLEARTLLARLARRLGREPDARRHDAGADRIRGQLDRLWSPEDQLFFAGSRDCRQPDVWGSAYACTIGALGDERRRQVAKSLWEKRDRILFRSQVRHLPTPLHWQRLIVDAEWTKPGQFQNGAYWGTATGWVAEAFELHRAGSGVELLDALVDDFEASGVWECIGPGGYQRIANNVSSAALPFASFKRLIKGG